MIFKAIAHRIIKSQNETGNASLVCRDSEYPQGDSLSFLIKKATELYDSRSRKNYGIFREATENARQYPFNEYLRTYLTQDFSFVDFSIIAMQHLQAVLNHPEASGATGGDIFFVEKQDEQTHNLYILMLKSEKGVSLDDDNLDIIANTHLDLSKLHTASKIDINMFNDNFALQQVNGEENVIPGVNKYISFIKGRSKTYLKYYTEFIGAKELADTKYNTEKFVEAVEAFIIHKQFDASQKNDFRLRVHEYCLDRNRRGDYVDIELLSNYLSNEVPDEFSTFINEHHSQFDGFFEVNTESLKLLNTFSGTNQNITVHFNKKLLDNNFITWQRNILKIKGDVIPLELKQKLDNYIAPNDNTPRTV